MPPKWGDRTNERRRIWFTPLLFLSDVAGATACYSFDAGRVIFVSGAGGLSLLSPPLFQREPLRAERLLPRPLAGLAARPSSRAGRRRAAAPPPSYLAPGARPGGSRATTRAPGAAPTEARAAGPGRARRASGRGPSPGAPAAAAEDSPGPAPPGTLAEGRQAPRGPRASGAPAPVSTRAAPQRGRGPRGAGARGAWGRRRLRCRRRRLVVRLLLRRPGGREPSIARAPGAAPLTRGPPRPPPPKRPAPRPAPGARRGSTPPLRVGRDRCQQTSDASGRRGCGGWTRPRTSSLSSATKRRDALRAYRPPPAPGALPPTKTDGVLPRTRLPFINEEPTASRDLFRRFPPLRLGLWTFVPVVRPCVSYTSLLKRPFVVGNYRTRSPGGGGEKKIMEISTEN